MELFGIDISAYQSDMNIETAKNEGVKFAIVRGGFTAIGNGVSCYKDSAFENLYSRCKALGIPVGSYWYSCANTYQKGVNEANFLYENCLKGKQFEYPIYIDVEDATNQSGDIRGTTDAIKGFCETLESKGYYVGIYANVNWFRNYIYTGELDKYDKWVACWSKERPSYPQGGLWQFGGSTNLVRTNIVAGMVCDQDFAYYDYPTIIKEKGLNGYNSEPTPQPQPEPTPQPQPDLLDLVRRTIRGDFGNGEERVKQLGDMYDEVQRQVNLNYEHGTTQWDNVRLY